MMLTFVKMADFISGTYRTCREGGDQRLHFRVGFEATAVVRTTILGTATNDSE